MKAVISVRALESAVLRGQTIPATSYTCTRAAHTQTTARRRHLHSSPSSSQTASLSSLPPSSLSPATPAAEIRHAASTSKPPPPSVLATLPMSQVLRTYLITAISSSPIMLDASSAVLRRMLKSKSFLFSLEKNPLARLLLWETFYKQFCAGSNRSEIAQTCQKLRKQGYGGVVLEYALEVLEAEEGAAGSELKDIARWKKGMLDSVSMALPGDFVALKWSGMGSAALKLCAAEKPPSKEMDEAMHAICTAASKKNIALLPSAEETWNLPGYHAWTLNLQRIYNRQGKSVMYNTYQCYLKSAPATVSQHLDIARREGFTLGAKLVRGAYLASEPRHLIHDTMEDTHAGFDGIMSALIKRGYNDTLKPTSQSTGPWPETNVFVATHNASSVALAQSLRQAQADSGETLTPLAFSQLQGMADEVSCKLLAAARDEAGEGKVKEKVFKYTSWGTMTECLNYLLRRAAENKDAASRTADTRKAMGGEMWRRLKGVVGFA